MWEVTFLWNNKRSELNGTMTSYSPTVPHEETKVTGASGQIVFLSFVTVIGQRGWSLLLSQCFSAPGTMRGGLRINSLAGSTYQVQKAGMVTSFYCGNREAQRYTVAREVHTASPRFEPASARLQVHKATLRHVCLPVLGF